MKKTIFAVITTLALMACNNSVQINDNHTLEYSQSMFRRLAVNAPYRMMPNNWQKSLENDGFVLVEKTFDDYKNAEHYIFNYNVPRKIKRDLMDLSAEEREILNKHFADNKCVMRLNIYTVKNQPNLLSNVEFFIWSPQSNDFSDFTAIDETLWEQNTPSENTSFCRVDVEPETVYANHDQFIAALSSTVTGYWTARFFNAIDPKVFSEARLSWKCGLEVYYENVACNEVYGIIDYGPKE